MMSTCVSVSLFVEVATLAAEGIRVLISRIDEEIKQTSRFKDDLEEFKEQLTNISWLLAGASSASDSSTSGESSSSSSVPTPNPMMANWLKKIKEVSDNAEDLLDELSYETLKVRFRTRKRDKLKAGFTHPLMLRNLSHKVKDLKELIQSIYDDATKLGIEPIKVAAGDAYAIKPSRLVENKQRMLQIQRQCVDQELMIGRDEDVAHLVRLVCDPANNNKDLTIIGIVGFPDLYHCGKMRKNCGVCGSVNRSRKHRLSCLKGTKFIRTGKNICETGVRLPSRFVKNAGEFLESTACLYFHGVHMWRVQVTETNGSLSFGKDWAKLYRGYGMSKGTVLLFKYLGTSNFRVDIFRSHTGLAVNEPYYGIRPTDERQSTNESSTVARRVGRPSIDYEESEEVRSVELYGRKLRRFTIYNLRGELRFRKLADSGCKGELIERLGRFIMQHGPDYP